MRESGKSSQSLDQGGPNVTPAAETDASLKTRLDRLSERLDSVQDAREKTASTGKSSSGLVTSSAFGLGARVMGEFVGSIALGAALGWISDQILGTKPLLLMMFLGVGTVAGFWSVYRVAANIGKSAARSDTLDN